MPLIYFCGSLPFYTLHRDDWSISDRRQNGLRSSSQTTHIHFRGSSMTIMSLNIRGFGTTHKIPPIKGIMILHNPGMILIQ